MKRAIIFPLLLILLPVFSFSQQTATPNAWIRINQLGYLPDSKKAAVWCSKDSIIITSWQLIDAQTKKIATSGRPFNDYGSYGPFKKTYRLNFSDFKKPGKYYLQAGGVKSPVFEIGKDVYKGTADFALRYMRQQRCGFNPYLKDSCHNRGAYSLYGNKAGIPDSTYVDVWGGWHDASDYLQYSTTSANAAYNLLLAYREFPQVFGDNHLANGLDGKNNLPDVVDEAVWGIDWLLKMNPSANIMYNQVADDRDHINMRIPSLDSQYGRGYQRPVYFLNGEPQQRGKFMNSTTGNSSTAAKFATVYALARQLNIGKDPALYYGKAMDALNYANKKKGYAQTASVKSPYIYAEENWVDDIELAYISIHNMLLQTDSAAAKGYYLGQAVNYAGKEKTTPWLGADTAAHYQWYPFVNAGHYELLRQLKTGRAYPQRSTGFQPAFVQNFSRYTDSLRRWYYDGILQVSMKAKKNAFYRGIPFIWCSNNLTVAFAQQCYWYRTVVGDNSFEELEQANIDWLFGCNPWGTSMVYGLPSWGDTPADPHSAFTHLKNYPIDGGLVDGPVYGNIYKNLIGIKLNDPDEYADFQSPLVVYHDDYGDYSSNEPTMDGTASLVYLLAAQEARANNDNKNIYESGAIIRGDTTQKKLALVFTGDEFADGAASITKTLAKEKVKAAFFLTGRFYRNPKFASAIKQLKQDGHYMGPHSNNHILYAPWTNRDSLLVTKEMFGKDLAGNYISMESFGIKKNNGGYFLPPYEWYNETIAEWTKEHNKQLICYSPGTISHADYTWPELNNYRSSEAIISSVKNYEASSPKGLNGFILLMHIGTDPRRKDKLYDHLPELIQWLKQKGYSIERVDELLN